MDQFQQVCYCRSCRGIVHRIAQGDTLYSLSKKYRVTVDSIMDANPYINIYNLRIGESICIPTLQRPMPRNNNGAEANGQNMQDTMWNNMGGNGNYSNMFEGE